MEKLDDQKNYEKFMVEYQDYYEEYMDKYEVYESFYSYGPLTNNYWTYKPRILVCNLEPYDEREGNIIVDMNLYKEWIKANTGKYTAKFITGLLKKINKENNNDLISFENFSNTELLSYMENVAYMNFRISSGINVSADIEGILKDVRTHPDYIIAQMNTLCPDIIIIGGEVGCRAYNELFHAALKFNTTTILNGKVICSIKHFRKADYKYYNEKVNEILVCLNAIKKTQDYC